MNHSLIDEHHSVNNHLSYKYGDASEKNNSTFDANSNFNFDDSRAGLLSEEKP